jgi:hypothetical protein
VDSYTTPLRMRVFEKGLNTINQHKCWFIN